jgi:hypothetical protein
MPITCSDQTPSDHQAFESSTLRSSLFGGNTNGNGTFTFAAPPISPQDAAGSSRRSSEGGVDGRQYGRMGNGEMELTDAEAKRRKVQRACDVCRRKKIRCEGPMNSNSANSGCLCPGWLQSLIKL